MSEITLTKANFDQVVADNDFVLVDFWAPWCAPCRSFAPVFHEVAEKNPDIVFGKVNTEEQRGLASSFNIRSIPTLMIFREKVIIFSQPGAMLKSGLEDLLAKARGLDMAEVHKQIADEAASRKTPV